MKRVLMFLFIAIFLIGFLSAQYTEPGSDGTGLAQYEVVAAGGQEGEPKPAIMEKRQETIQERQKIIQEMQETAMQAKKQVRKGDFEIEGKNIRVEHRENNKIRLQSQGISAESELEFEEEITDTESKLKTKLSNGKYAEIKVMPNTASETALQRLRLKICSEENNCTIELKEVGSGEQVRAAYKVKAQKQAKIFGLFRARMNLESQIDAETGEVIKSKRPWWSFLATEEEPVVEETMEEEEKPAAEETTEGTITNFQECADAGNPVMGSYPRQCKANGENFVEEISE